MALPELARLRTHIELHIRPFQKRTSLLWYTWFVCAPLLENGAIHAATHTATHHFVLQCVLQRVLQCVLQYEIATCAPLLENGTAWAFSAVHTHYIYIYIYIYIYMSYICVLFYGTCDWCLIEWMLISKTRFVWREGKNERKKGKNEQRNDTAQTLTGLQTHTCPD